MHPRTRLCQFESAPQDPWHPASTPIYQTATFVMHAPDQPYGYSRSANPTRRVLEDLAADLENGAGALATTSGLAALALCLRLARPGQRIIACDDLYGGTHRILSSVAPRLGLSVEFATLDQLPAALDRGAALVFAESPTNPLLRIIDIRALAERCHAAGAKLIIDSSAMSPLLQNPLALGADVAMHSCTKLLGGHADATGGLLIAKDRPTLDELAFFHNAEGIALAPFDCWLTLRGIKTLAVRLDRQQASAAAIAQRLRERLPAVHFPGFADHPGREIHARQARGDGCILSARAGSPDLAAALLDRTRLFKTTFSFGSVHSSISRPASMSHACIPARERHDRGIPDDLVRLSIGLEDVEDLWADLDAAMV